MKDLSILPRACALILTFLVGYFASLVLPLNHLIEHGYADMNPVVCQGDLVCDLSLANESKLHSSFRIMLRTPEWLWGGRITQMRWIHNDLEIYITPGAH